MPSSPVFLGGAPEIAQINAYVLGGTWLATDTITVTIGFKAYTLVTGSTSITAILANLTAAFSNLDPSAWPEMAEQTAQNDGATTFTLTANTAGWPFTCTLSTNSLTGLIDGGASSAGSITTPNSGPWDYSVPANWSTGAVPVTGDTAIADRDGTIIRFGLAQAAVTLAEFRWLCPTGELGLPKVNTNGSPYPEYRPDYLQSGMTLINVNSAQSGRIKLNGGSVQFTANVNATGSGEEDNVPAMLLLGTHASNALSVLKGQVGVAFFGGEVATLASLAVSQVKSASDATVTLGTGVTLGAVKKTSGTLVISSAIGTSLTQLAGTTTINGTGGVAQLTIDGGTVVLNTTGTVAGNTVVSGNGFLDLTQDMQTKTFTNPIVLYGAAAGGSDANGVLARPYTVTYLNGAGKLNWNFGPNYKVVVSNPP